MKEIRVEKITLNIGTGKDQTRLEKGMRLLKNITGINPVKTVTNKRIQEWGIRPGLPIGCKITLRKKKAEQLLKRMIEAKGKKLSKNQFDNYGNLAFGINEYIDIPEVKYDPEIGIMGLEICITLERPGYRVKKRKIMKKRLPLKHQIRREEAIEFIKKKFDVKVE